MEASLGTVAGYAVVRRIAANGRAEVLLARLPARAGTDGSREGALVALKVFNPSCDPASIGLEVRALLDVPASLVGLRDVATTADGRICLVTDHLPGPTLDRLLATRGRLGPGELVTIAATVTATLQALHDKGLNQSVVRLAGVRFDGRGRPVLLGLGTLSELPDGAAGVQMRRDAALGLAGFVATLSGYLHPADPAAARAPELVAGFESHALAKPFPSSLAGLESGLFAWSPASPVRGVGQLAAVAAAPTDPPRPAALPAGQRVPGPATGGRSRPWSSRLGALAGRARRGRIPARPLLVGFGLAIAVSIAGLVLLSVADPGPGTGAGSIATGETGPGAADRTNAGPAPAAVGEAADEEAAGEETDRAAVEGDDPAAAALVLLRLRARCLAEASVLCLEDVHQQGSVAMVADGYLVRQRQSGAEPSADGDRLPADAQLRERTGDAALVAFAGAADGGVNAQPASALMIKGEAGWRLRELFDY